MKNRVLGLDGLRMLAVLVVVLGHLLGFPRGGFLGVDIFFVLSGYIIGRNILSGSYSSILQFYTKRLKRIIPPILITLLLILVAGILLKNYLYFHYIGNILSFTLNLAFLRDQNSYNLATVSSYSPITHLWSLSIEEQFYLLSPLLFFLVKFKKSFFLVLTLGVGSLALYFYNFAEFGGRGNYYSSLARFWEIIFGLLIAYIELNYSKFFVKYQERVNGKWAYCLLLTILFLTIFTSQGIANSKISQLLVVLMVMLLIPVANIKLLSNKVAVYLGKRSYGIYLYHIPIFYCLFAYGDNWFYKVTAVILVFVLASFSYRYVELSIINSKIGFLKSFFITLLSFSLVIAFSFYIPTVKDNSVSALSKGYQKELQNLCNSQFISCNNGITINDNGAWIECRGKSDYVFDHYSRCLAKGSNSELKVMVMGDSTPLSYIPGLVEKGRGYKLYMNINYGCGWVASTLDDRKLGSNKDHECIQTVADSIAYLEKVKPDLVVLSMRAQQSYTVAFLHSFKGETTSLNETRSRVLGYYEKYLAIIEKKAKKVLLVLPPDYLESKNCEHPAKSPDLCQEFFKDPKVSEYYQRENKKLMLELLSHHPEVYMFDAEKYTCLPSLSKCLWENPVGQTRGGQVHLSFWLSFDFGNYLNNEITSIL